MDKFFNQSLILLFMLFFMLAPAFIFFWWIKWKRGGRRNPLTRNILRGPGESLRERITLLDDKINESIFWFAGIPIFLTGLIFNQSLFHGQQPGLGHFLAMLILLPIFLFIPYRKMAKNLQERFSYRLGLDAELAVGHELNLLMLEGFHVYHDFPEEHNNIDHIVVGPAGVFAIETKGRAKPDKGRGGMDAKVIYDGSHLIFPDLIKDSASVQQARKQARSLAKWLSSAVGEPVKVQAALALPGWFVERKKVDGLILLYGQSSQYAHALQGKEVLSDSQIKRIVHQIEQKCRDVKPKSYQEPIG